MSIRLDLWRVDGKTLMEVPSKTLDFEQRLEDWLAADSALTGMDVLIVGRQVQTDHGGRIDLLGLDRDGNTVVFELKRGRTPRDVVAQTLDYASWVKELSYARIERTATAYLGRDLAGAFDECFGEPLPEVINSEHTLVIVAPELDESSERIIEYLADSGNLAINAVFFNCFEVDGIELVGRAWFRDPAELEEQRVQPQQAPWSGYWFVNVGDGPHRTWEDNRRYGFLGAGQGEKYSKPLRKLRMGDHVFAYMRGLGYVGHGEVVAEAMMIRDFRVDGRSLLDLPLEADRPWENQDDPKLSEWVVGIKWHKTFARGDARTFKGVFANQNIVCRLRQPETLRFVEHEFGVSRSAGD